MTINSKDITELVDEHCSSISFTELDSLLNKLDHEYLDVLRAMLEEVYESGKEQGTDDRYEEGYSDGYSEGLSEGA